MNPHPRNDPPPPDVSIVVPLYDEAGNLAELVERIAGTPEEKPIAFLVLRTMQKARYDVANLGHFGLATGRYTHFTSPIRRYPDLLVHRALRAERRHGRALDEEARVARTDVLREWARQASDRERRADDAERELVQWKKVRFMADKVGDTFDGYVTGVAPFGLFVELAEHFVEGLVHVSSMSDDYYRFLDRMHALQGEATRRRYRLGDRVRVQVAKVDFERRQIDLVLEDVVARLSRQPGRGRVEVVPHDPKAARRAGAPGRKKTPAREGRKSAPRGPSARTARGPETSPRGGADRPKKASCPGKRERGAKKARQP